MLLDGHLKRIETVTTEFKQHFNRYNSQQEDHIGRYFRREARKRKENKVVLFTL